MCGFQGKSLRYNKTILMPSSLMNDFKFSLPLRLEIKIKKTFDPVYLNLMLLP